MRDRFVESFNRRLRDECLNARLFDNLCHARNTVKAWRSGLKRRSHIADNRNYKIRPDVR
jgi:hypothetical protein